MSYINIQSIFLFYSAFLFLCVLALLIFFWGQKDKSSTLWILSCLGTGTATFITVFRDGIPLVISYSAMVCLEVASNLLLSQSVKALDLRTRWRSFIPWIFILAISLFIVLEFLRANAGGVITPFMSLLVAIYFSLANLYGSYVSYRVAKSHKDKIFFHCLSGLFLIVSLLQFWRVINSLTGYSYFAFDQKLLTLVAYFFIFVFSALRALTYIILRMHLAYAEGKMANSINIRLVNVIEERNEMISRLQKLNKVAAVNALASTVAHEVNQPLGASKIDAQLILHALKNQPENTKILETAALSLVSNVDQASGIIRNLSDLTRGLTSERTELSINTMLEEVIEISSAKFKAQKIEVVLELSGQVLVNGNKSELQQVFINILNNAFEELQGLDQSSKRISVVSKQEGDKTLISISDNGRGIEGSQKEAIFELLNTSKSQGSGIGLWLCRDIISRHNGAVWCESAIGGGATFIVKLPIFSA
jgi:signal transduction histidine kinase